LLPLGKVEDGKDTDTDDLSEFTKLSASSESSSSNVKPNVVNISDLSDSQDSDTDSTLRRSKRVCKPVERLNVNHIIAESNVNDDEYVRKIDLALLLFDKVFPT
jgi:hypothetical protein